MTFPPPLPRFSPATLARLGLACIGTVTLAFILLCLAALMQARQDATAAAETQARNIAAGVALDVARNLDLYDLSLQAAVQAIQTPGIQQLDSELRRMLLFPRAARGPYFSFINVLDATGTVVADSESATPRGGNYAGRDYFVAQRHDARDRLFIGAPFLTQSGQSPTISISRRISGPDGSFAGVVVGSMRLAYFRDLFSSLNLGPHGTIALLRRDGVILMRLPFNRDDIGRTLPPDAPFFHAPTGVEVNALDPTDHLRRRFLFEPVANLPLAVAVGLADADIYAAWHGRAVALGMAVAALSAIDVGLLLVLGYAVGRREQGEAALRASHTRVQALAAQREAALNAMSQTVAMKSRFLATMSHELRTPLNSILGYAELLALDGPLPLAQAGRLAAMRGAGAHLRAVIDRVLDFSRIEAGDHPVLPVPTNLPALVSDCHAVVAPLAARRGLALHEHIAADVPRDVLADATGLRQVVHNLLDNAIKFTDQGDVSLLVSRSPAGIRFAVTDTGVGVPPAQRDKLFQPYERGQADRLGVPGTGLGLAIAAELVGHMGGRIGHEDNPGGGSVFWFAVPLPEAPAAPGIAPQAAEPVHTRPLHALVVDDSALNRDVAATFLRRAGHTVVEAEDGEAALSRAAAEDFDVILMDIRMERLDGITAARCIRALPAPRGLTPIIALTAQVDEDDGKALREAGFQARLVKPIDRHQLRAAVAAATSSASAASPGTAPPEPPATRPDVSADPAAATDVAMDAATGADPAANPTAATDAATDAAVAGHHIAAFADMLCRTLALLDAQPSAPALADLVHRIAGDAGQLGHAALMASARQLEIALRHGNGERAGLAAALRRTASDVLANTPLVTAAPCPRA